jgi:simple sugar transport system ATP-binding protein
VTGPLGTFDRKVARKRVVELSEQYGLNVNPDATIEDLPVGVRQRVEILKALYRKSDVLVLDEPSAVLTPAETEELFTIIRGLAKGGTSVIFITHKLGEVLEVADRITVLRRGAVAGTVDPKESSPQQLAQLMVGRDVDLVVDKDPAKPGDVVLSLEDVHILDDRFGMAVKGVSLDVRAGEIVAIAGVQGNGQTELVEAIVGLRTIDSGTITISGENVNKASPRHVADLGVAHIPEDRMRDGLIAGMTVEENYILNSYHREPYSSGVRLHAKAIDAGAAQGAVGGDDGRLPVRRQPAEGRRRARVLPAAQARHRVAADAWSRCRLDRVHPPADRGTARRRRSDPHHQHGARRGPGGGRSDRGDVRRQGRGHPGGR